MTFHETICVTSEATHRVDFALGSGSLMQDMGRVGAAVLLRLGASRKTVSVFGMADSEGEL